MTDHLLVRDSIINISGLPSAELPQGDGAVWTTPDPVYLPAIKTLCEPELYSMDTALGTFTKVVTVMKNSFYMSIVENIKEREERVPTEEVLRAFVEGLEKEGFGKTLLVGHYRNKEFMGSVVKWCNSHGYFVLFPFSMDVPVELFVDKQLTLYVHDTIC